MNYIQQIAAQRAAAGFSVPGYDQIFPQGGPGVTGQYPAQPPAQQPQQPPAQQPTGQVAPTPTESGAGGNSIDFSKVNDNTFPNYIQGGEYLNEDYHNYMNQIPGWTDQAQNTLQQTEPGQVGSLTPGINSAYQNAQGQMPGLMSQAVQGVNTGYQDAQNYLPQMYQGALQPMMQQAINQMAGRNMVNSSVGADAMGNAMAKANQQILGQQAQLSGQQAGQLAQLAGQGYQTQAQLAGAQAQGIASGLGSTQDNQTRLDAIQQANYGNLANQQFNAQNQASLSHMNHIGSLVGGYANQSSNLNAHEYDLMAQLLPTFLNYNNP